LPITYIRHFKLAKEKGNDNRRNRKESINPVKKRVNRKSEDIDSTKGKLKDKGESKKTIGKGYNKTKGEKIFVLAPGY
jgi:hypothetical protein